jgi:2'-5' RNA ligase
MSDEVFGLVLDLPAEAWTKKIRSLRAKYDHARASFPIEITVAGSSGLGWFSPGQTPDFIANLARQIARTFVSFTSHFSGVEKFAGSHVYYLALKDEKPFHAFQKSLAASPLLFEPTPFSYKPHCTIAALADDASASAHAAIAAFPVPAHGVTISSLSLYGVVQSRNECRFIWQLPLRAK